MQHLREFAPCDTHGLFFDDLNRVADTPTALAGLNAQVDQEALFSLLQFGAIVPPLSPWQGVKRFLPGYKYAGTKLIAPIELCRSHQVRNLDPEQQADEIERLLDAVLLKLIGDREDPVVLFSGGVDSGIIACRLVALGYGNSLLLHYSFGEDDEETKLAEAMSQELGLKFECVSANRHLCDCLTEPGRIYSQPFGDNSTVPTSDLAYGVINRLAGQKRLILDGTGADGAFGMVNSIAKWYRFHRIPAIIKKSASFLYSSILWQKNRRIEYYSRKLRAAIDMPLLSAALAHNPLAGVFYNKLARKSVDGYLVDWIGGWAGELQSERMVAGDLALTCANIYAQKAQPILESAGHKVIYPFLETEVVTTGIESITHWHMDEPKAPLKRALARYIPHDMVYRPKSPFIDPRAAVFFDSDFIAYLRATAEPTSPLFPFLEKKPLIKACDLLSQKKTLPPQTLNCLWTIVFGDRWYRTAR